MSMKIFATALLFIIISTQLFAEATKIYTWRNEKGELVFSDTPKLGAKEIIVIPKNNISSPIDTSILDRTPQKNIEKYQIKIINPDQEASIRDNTGSVYIAGEIQPTLKTDQKIQLYLDGKKYQKPRSKPVFILQNVDRGEHQIKMILLNNLGKVIATSKVTTFYLFRISKIKPN